MKKYVICVEADGQKKYVLVDLTSGESRGVDDKSLATALPGKAVASAVVKSIKPAIKREKLDANIYYEVL